MTMIPDSFNNPNIYVAGVVGCKVKSTLISKSISFITRSNYTHVEFFLSDYSTTIGSRPPHKDSNGNWNSGGVDFYKLSDPFLERFELFHFYNPFTQSRLYDTEDDKIIKSNLIKYIGNEYDFPGVIGFLFNKTNGRDNLWWCSELISDITSKTKQEIINGYIYDNKLVSPKDILSSPFLKTRTELVKLGVNINES